MPIAHIRRRSAFSSGSVIARASASGGGTMRTSAWKCAPRTAPSVYLPGSLRAESSIARWAGLSSRNLATCSASSLSMARQSHHSIMFSMRLADSGKSSSEWVMAQYQAPYFRQSRMALAV